MFSFCVKSVPGVVVSIGDFFYADPPWRLDHL